MNPNTFKLMALAAFLSLVPLCLFACQEPPPCRDMVEKRGDLCGDWDTNAMNAALTLCDTGECDQWRNCIDAASDCDEAQNCSSNSITCP